MIRVHTVCTGKICFCDTKYICVHMRPPHTIIFSMADIRLTLSLLVSSELGSSVSYFSRRFFHNTYFGGLLVRILYNTCCLVSLIPKGLSATRQLLVYAFRRIPVFVSLTSRIQRDVIDIRQVYCCDSLMGKYNFVVFFGFCTFTLLKLRQYLMVLVSNLVLFCTFFEYGQCSCFFYIYVLNSDIVKEMVPLTTSEAQCSVIPRGTDCRMLSC